MVGGMVVLQNFIFYSYEMNLSLQIIILNF